MNDDEDTEIDFVSNAEQAYGGAEVGSFILTAQLYMRAVNRLGGFGSGEFPKLLLTLFALELAMKAFLLSKGETIVVLKKIGHDLEALYKDSLSHGFAKTAELDAVVADYSDMHLNHGLRYGDRGHFKFKNPDKAIRTVDVVVEQIRKSLLKV